MAPKPVTGKQREKGVRLGWLAKFLYNTRGEMLQEFGLWSSYLTELWCTEDVFLAIFGKWPLCLRVRSFCSSLSLSLMCIRGDLNTKSDDVWEFWRLSPEWGCDFNQHWSITGLTCRTECLTAAIAKTVVPELEAQGPNSLLLLFVVQCPEACSVLQMSR